MKNIIEQTQLKFFFFFFFFFSGNGFLYTDSTSFLFIFKVCLWLLAGSHLDFILEAWWMFKLFAACAATSASLTSSSAATTAAPAFNIRMSLLFLSSIFHAIYQSINFECFASKSGSYCSNYYTELGRADPIQVCDWCRCEGRTSSSSRSHGTSSKRPPPTSERIKQHHEDASSSVGEKGKHGTAGGVPSPKPTTRRYKLLKDVMCWKRGRWIGFL